MYRMPGIGAALIADHPVRALGEHVDQLPFTLIAPLSTDDDDRPCARIKHVDPDKSV